MTDSRTLIYKRTHSGDPDPSTGVFGCNNCMRSVRGWSFEAVIGVGGIGREPQQEGISRKLTWIGIGRRQLGVGGDGYPLWAFDHFLYYGPRGPILKTVAPAIAKRIYEGGVRLVFDTSLSKQEREEVESILDLARNAVSVEPFVTAPQYEETQHGEGPSACSRRHRDAAKAGREPTADRAGKCGGRR